MHNKSKINVNSIASLDFSGFFMLFIICLLFCLNNAEGAEHEISEVFIEATGNNKFEAKIKAHEYGMMRAFLIVADKMGIKNTDIKQVPYFRLKKVFIPSIINNELATIDKDIATVNYKYDKAGLYQLLLDYGNSFIDDMFYECLVIPVFKKKKIINIWDKEAKWHDIWISLQTELNQHKIVLPMKSLFASKKITPANILSLNYEDFIEIFPNILFKKVIIVTSEYFTNHKTGETVMKVENNILATGSDESKNITEEYSLSSFDQINAKVEMLIDKIIAQYGSVRVNANSNDQQRLNELVEEPKHILMNSEIFSQEEMDIIINKLNKVSQIDKFVIDHDYDTRYKILIFTNVSEFELAEGLYLSGLSYKIHGNLYNLIDVKKGS